MTMGYTCIMNMNSKHKICSCIFLYFHVEIRCTHGMGFFFLLSRIFTRCCWYYYFALPGGRLCARITFIISYIPCNIDGEIHSQFMHSLLNTWILSVSWCVHVFYVEYINVYCVLCVGCLRAFEPVCVCIFLRLVPNQICFFYSSTNNDAFSIEWASTSVHKIISDRIMTIHAHLDWPNIGCFEINLQINGTEI